MASNQGIMSLSRPMSMDESYGAAQQKMAQTNPQVSKAVNQVMDSLAPKLNKLDDKTLDLLLQLTQYLTEHKSKYKQLMAKLEDSGALPAGILPDKYDPKFLSVFALSIAHAKEANNGMASGGIADVAQHIKNQGRGKDTILAHINPKEAQMLRSKGGIGTLNPTTGLPEFGFFDDILGGLKSVGDIIGDVLRPVGDVIGDVIRSPLGLAATAAGAYFLGAPFFGAETIPTLAESALPGEAAAGLTDTAMATDAVSHLTPAAIESGLGSPGYGYNASAAESGLFDPSTVGSGANASFPV